MPDTRILRIMRNAQINDYSDCVLFPEYLKKVESGLRKRGIIFQSLEVVFDDYYTIIKKDGMFNVIGPDFELLFDWSCKIEHGLGLGHGFAYGIKVYHGKNGCSDLPYGCVHTRENLDHISYQARKANRYI